MGRKDHRPQSVPIEDRSPWPTTTLADAGVLLFDCEHKTPAAASSGIPYITIPQMKAGRLDPAGARLVAPSDVPIWNRRVTPSEGDIVLSRRTNPGASAVVPPDFPCVLGQNLVILRSQGPRVHQEFLRWVVRSPGWWQEVQRYLNVGAVFDSLRCSDIPKFKIPVPPITTQRAIAHILGTLDDKIELNRRTSETLETMARALFKSWFVDFDPVCAKADGSDTGLPDEITALFPDALAAHRDLGEIPEGWGVGSILDRAELLSGGTPKTARPEYWDGQIAWASARDVSQSSWSLLLETDRTITQQGLDESATQIVPAFSSVVVARGATTGRMVLLGCDMAMNQTCYALATSTHTPFALYCLLRKEIGALVHAAHGSVFNTITTRTFASSRIVLPPLSLSKAFEDRVAPMFRRILECVCESRTLAALRDALLPKLISGDLRLDDPDRILERAG